MTEKSWLSAPMSVFLGATSYDSLKPIMKAVVEGYMAASEGKFPPHNPYAICGLYAGEEKDNLEGGAWFYGYWEFFKRQKK